MKKAVVVGTALACALASPFVRAESDINTAAGPSTASARIDFEVVIPRVLFLQVGTGTLQADNTTVDKVTFTVPAATLADGNPIAGTPSSGNVTVRVFGNGGDVTLKAASAGQLSNGTETIPWSELDVATASLVTGNGFTPTAIPHPAIDDATGITLTATAKVVRQSAQWTYSYKNTAAYAAGTYGGTNTNNSRITYTASMP